ncbi:MAG: tyrosine-type recombinase/integrase [Flavobacterium sp.]|uniref:tyrosine-type recombinase/integrase n=1 Tax=Flavobacterium sp. TaxID=239 RepID=UPI0022BC000B|nr:tyrosine-type recombinase/integrase [Flavobacterium sp.]MCZ8297017.1 tyrosine-type recombinase/integrase [Flavobacterium sp.]
MPTIKYRINKDSKNDPTQVYLRFRGANFDCETPIDILVSKNNWSASKQCLKATGDLHVDRTKINEQLDEIKALVKKNYNLDYTNGIKINTKWLKNIINKYHNQEEKSSEDESKYLSSYGKLFVEKAKIRRNKRTGKPLDKRTIQDFENTIAKVNQYGNYIKSKVLLSNANLSFHRDFINYLRTEQHLGENTIGGIISNIKSFLKDAEIAGLNVHKDYKSSDFYCPSFKPKDIYLNEDEIELIRKQSFDFDGYLDVARDWLIVGVWTGLRISDLLRLTKKDIKKGFIDNTNFKTDIPVTIPIHPHVKVILDKRDGHFPRPISEVKFNDYIKRVAKICGLTEMLQGAKLVQLLDNKGNPLKDDEGKLIYRKKEGVYPKYELVTSHICRRSFATNLYGKIDTLTIMKITGHQTEKQFLGYIKITAKHHAEKLSQLWAEYYK